MSMRSKTLNIWWLVLSTYIMLSAFGCGGGGGGGGPAQPITGPGDTGNYFPFTVGNTWVFQGTVSENAMSLNKVLMKAAKAGLRGTALQAGTVTTSNLMKITGTKVLNGVEVTVFSQSITAEETYLFKDNNGITYYGNNDPTDTLTPQLIPYQIMNFPLEAGSNFVQVDRKGLDIGEDFDGDGKNETVDIYSTVTVVGFETVTVPAGTFTESVKIQTNEIDTITLSSDGTKITAIGTTTQWYAKGVGPAKEIQSIVLQYAGLTSSVTETEELTSYIVNGVGHGIRIDVTPASASVGIGGTVQFNAVAYDQFNTPISGVTFTWASSNPTVATVDSTGVATGIAPGTTDITASTAGVTSNSAVLTVQDIRQLSLATNDIVYNPSTQKIYASVPGRAGTIGNSIAVINPQTGSIDVAVSIGSEPGKLALSDDGQILYVSLDGAAAVRLLDLTTSTPLPGLQFSLGSDPFAGPYFVEDMEVLPGSAHSVAISRKFQGSSPRHAGVAIYDDGVKRPVETPTHTGSNVIEFSATASRLYGYNNETTEFGFRRMTVDASGVSVLDATQSLIAGFGVDIKFDGGRIYTTSGLIIDPEARTLIGTFTGIEFGYPVEPDSSVGRTYFLIPPILGGVPWTINAFNQNTFVPLAAIDIPGVSGSAGGLIRWGTNGLAFRTSGDQIFLVRTTLIP